MRNRVCMCLAILLAAGQASAQSAGGIDRARIWSGEDADFLTGDVSPDGRYFSDIDWNSGDLRLIDLKTGKARDLTSRGYDAGRYAWTSAFSRDGRRIAVAWYSYSAGAHELRIHDLSTGSSRLLVPADAEMAYFSPVDWSPAGDSILVALRGADRIWRLALVDVETGAARTLASLDWPAPGGGQSQSYPRAEFSPDGDVVAFDYPTDPEKMARDIYILPVGTGERKTVYRGGGATRFLGWLPGGGGLLFYDDRRGGSGVWRLPLKGGAAGEPQLVERNLPGLVPLGFAGDAYAYGVTVASAKAHVAALDPQSSRLMAAPQPVDGVAMRSAMAADFSPDGRRIAIVSHNPLPRAPETIAIHSTDGRFVQEIPVPPSIHTSSGTIEWLGNEQIYLFGRERGDFGAFRLDVGNGSFTRISPEPKPGDGWKFFDMSPDGGTLYLARRSQAKRSRHDIVAHDLESGTERVVQTARLDQRTLAVSPDGRKIAYIGRREGGAYELRTADAAGAEQEAIVHRVAGGESMHAPVAWTPDGSRILFVASSGDGQAGLWSVASDGAGAPVRIKGTEWCCESQDLQFHPDSRRVLFIAGKERAEIWMLKAF